jgi:excisionase family DNA binding protein
MAQVLFSVFEVASRLNLHVKTVRNYVRGGQLKATRIGKQYRISRADLEAFTGHPVPPTEREVAKRYRHVEVSSIVQIDAISPESSARLQRTIAAFGNPDREGDALRIETMYDRHLGRLKVIVIGAAHAAVEAIEVIAKLSETCE